MTIKLMGTKLEGFGYGGASSDMSSSGATSAEEYTNDKLMVQNIIYNSAHGGDDDGSSSPSSSGMHFLHDINQSEACWHSCHPHYGHGDDEYNSCVSYYHEAYYDRSSFTSWLAFWCKAMIRRIFLRYLYSPVYLIVLPLLVGVLIGWCLASKSKSRNVEAKQNISKECPRSQQRSPFSRLQRCLGQLLNCSIHFLVVRIIPTLKQLRGQFTNAERPAIITRTESQPKGNAHELHGVASSCAIDESEQLRLKEEDARRSKYAEDLHFEAGVSKDSIPKHVAVIMDGNRRYGRAKYGIASKGHWDGSSKLCDFAKWCQCEGIKALTVYAFSTENWRRDPAEIDQLMDIITTYCDEIRVEAIERHMQVKVLTTDASLIPERVRKGIQRLEDGTAHCRDFRLNICLSYGSRGEIVNACQHLVNKSIAIKKGDTDPNCKHYQITEQDISDNLLTSPKYSLHGEAGEGPIFPSDPEVLLRTSGEMRVSNFLLWQLAYTEFFFLPCQWPEIQKSDLIDVIQKFASGRQRRFGK